MDLQVTAGFARAFSEAARLAKGRDPAVLCVNDLLSALLGDPESMAADRLREHGANLNDAFCGNDPCDTASDEIVAVAEPRYKLWCDDRNVRPGVWSEGVEWLCRDLARLVREVPEIEQLGTEHLLWAICRSEHPIGRLLRKQGLDADQLRESALLRYGLIAAPDAEPICMTDIGLPDYAPMEDRCCLDDDGAAKDDVSIDHDVSVKADAVKSEAVKQKVQSKVETRNTDLNVIRLIDAAMNRTREGLRVVEDYVRFVLDDHELTQQFKQLRHDLAAALKGLSLDDRLQARDTQGDVGTQAQTEAEYRRSDPIEVLTANFMRMQESLRSIEEYGKTIDPIMAGAVEQIRYRTYTLHKAVASIVRATNRVGDRRLYVLIDGCVEDDVSKTERFDRLVDALLESRSVDIIQLRDKRLDDRALLARARRLRERIDWSWANHHSDTPGLKQLMIMNDRPDIAMLSGADGVHVGQDELSVRDVRTIVGPKMLVGVSTHSIEQARAAVLEGADYIGVGPTFPSGTKQFERFPGVGLLQQVAREIGLPSFAIGGINAGNVRQVTGCGIRRVAVSGAITCSDDPLASARHLRNELDG